MLQSICSARLSSWLLMIADVFLVRGWVLDELSTSEAILAHFVVTLLIGTCIFFHRKSGRTRIIGAILICLLVGPVGGIVLLIVDLGRNVVPPATTESDSETKAVTLADTLHFQILQNRRRRASGTLPRPFVETFVSEDLVGQQKAIAAISLNYRPEMLPSLRTALACNTPALRVQAAAVYAKLRSRFGEQAKSVLAAVAANGFTPELAAEARIVANSGFVDAETAAELHAISRVVPGRAREGRSFVIPKTPRAPLLRPPRLRRHSCGGVA